MAVIPVHPDAAKSWALLTDRIAAERNPVHQRNLSIVAQHVAAEVAGDVAGIDATLVESPSYSFWGGATTRHLDGLDAVNAFYANNISSGKNRLAFDITRVVVDDDTVVTEGVFWHVTPGAEALGASGPNGEPLDPEAHYLTRYQALVVWPITMEGLIAGEEIYLGQPHQVVREVARGDLPHLGFLPAD